MNGVQLTSWNALYAGIVSSTKAMIKWMVTNPAGWAIIATASVLGLVTAIDSLIITAEEQIKINDELKESYEEIVSEQESLQSKLDTTESRINELNGMDKLTLLEQGELERLQQENKELENRISLLKEEANLKSTEVNSGIEDWFKKDFQTKDEETFEVEKYKTGNTVWNAKNQQFEDEYAYSNTNVYKTELELFDERISRAKELIALGEKRTSSEEAELKEIREITTEVGSRIAKETEGYQTITEEQKQQKFLWENMIANSAFVADPAKYQTQKFDELWSSEDFKRYKDELEQFSVAGELNGSVISSNENFKKLLDATGASAEEVADHINKITSEAEDLGKSSNKTPLLSYSDTIAELDKMKDAFSTLGSAYEKFKDSDKDISFSELSALSESFKDVSGIENYVKAIQDAGDNTEAMQSAFDNLTGAYLEQTGILDQVNDGNAQLIENYLTEQGVTNASIIVQQALADNLAKVTAEKYYNAQASAALGGATASEIGAILSEAEAAGISGAELARLELAKIAVNGAFIMVL